jgi:membrane associated rhomboid family serine protease
MATCYRHPSRETGLSCSNCGRPICTDCMTATPVGPRCPDCAGRRTRVSAPGAVKATQAPLTRLLIGVNVVIFLISAIQSGQSSHLTGGNPLSRLDLHMALFGPAVAAGDTYRLLTAAFLHFGIFHIAFNMYALYLLGTALETYVGTFRFGAIYLISALAGSLGALILTPNTIEGGASGAVFGLMGALLVLQRQQGMRLLEGPIGGLLVINLIITFGVPHISIGGHLGGLAGGVATGLVLSHFGRGHIAYGRLTPVTFVALAALVVGTVACSVAVA